jgi:hypothetical protein
LNSKIQPASDSSSQPYQSSIADIVFKLAYTIPSLTGKEIRPAWDTAVDRFYKAFLVNSLRNRHEQISRIIQMRLRIELDRPRFGIGKDLRGQLQDLNQETILLELSYSLELARYAINDKEH